MEIQVKWLGISVSVLVVSLAVLGKAASLTVPATDPTEPIEIRSVFPGLAESRDLSAWVLEVKNEPTRETARLPTLRAREVGWTSVANRNSNPLNIKLGSETRRYVAVGLATISEIIPKDGGRFLKFDSAETGFRAALELLSTPRYADLQLNRALQRWSNSGYGTAILAGTQLDAQKPIPSLGEDDLRILLNAMAAAEGYKSSTIGDEIDNALRP